MASCGESLGECGGEMLSVVCWWIVSGAQAVIKHTDMFVLQEILGGDREGVFLGITQMIPFRPTCVCKFSCVCLFLCVLG